MIRPHRQQPLWFAYILHRLSGLLLVVFLPAHFYVLGLALNQSVQLDTLLGWAENPLVKFLEVVLVFLLAVHMFGGLRLMALEFMPWNPKQKTFAAIATATSFFIAVGFLLRAF